ncbi:unnamed protein product [Dimorphilus gyrociliatus]|uniref:Uncharacterized protein n=1 Tax=Dimorphilus gyrociliatus TaxID=2664684 RepID=A0A7I8W153_9ANNE|nr:unnamed protein product [Dimorphilus gyrociliatus]
MNFSLKTEKSYDVDYRPKLVGWKDKKKRKKARETPTSSFLKKAQKELPTAFYKPLQIVIKRLFSELSESERLRLIEQAIELCGSKFELIYSLNNFLPENYVVTIQRRGVVLRLCDGGNGQSLYRSEHLRFIKRMKSLLPPSVFNLAIEQLDIIIKPPLDCRICAIEKVISILSPFKDLALEVNSFLPATYKIKKVGRATFIFTHPPRMGSGVTTDYYADSCHTDTHYE